jgi:hypothetical protein
VEVVGRVGVGGEVKEVEEGVVRTVVCTVVCTTDTVPSGWAQYARHEVNPNNGLSAPPVPSVLSLLSVLVEPSVLSLLSVPSVPVFSSCVWLWSSVA